MQTTKICACHEQPTPYRNFPTKTSNINRKKEKKKNKRKKQIQRMSTCQHKTVLYPTCADALCRFFADHENHGCVVLKRTEDKTLERKIFKYVTLLDWNWHRHRCYTTNCYWRMFLYLAQLTFYTRQCHGVTRLVVPLPLLAARVGGCPAVVCWRCPRTPLQQTDAAEPGFT